MKRLFTLIVLVFAIGCHGRYDSPTSPSPTPRPATPLRIVIRVDPTSNNHCSPYTVQFKAKVTGMGYEIPPIPVRPGIDSELLAPNNEDFLVTYWPDDQPLVVYEMKSDVGRFNTTAVTVDLSCVRPGGL
jgi:hypothetical protein